MLTVPRKIEGLCIENLLYSDFLLFSWTFSYAGDSDFELSVKGATVGIEDLQVEIQL